MSTYKTATTSDPHRLLNACMALIGLKIDFHVKIDGPRWDLSYEFAVAETGENTTQIVQRELSVETQSPVIFRAVEDGDGKFAYAFALFPASPSYRYTDRPGHAAVQSYQLVGAGFSHADYEGCLAKSRPATPEEYAALFQKLMRNGANYVIYQYRTAEALKTYKQTYFEIYGVESNHDKVSQ